MVKIVLEDKGQDLLWLKVNEGGLVEEAGPFQNEIWKDAYVPYWESMSVSFAQYITHHISFKDFYSIKLNQ